MDAERSASLGLRQLSAIDALLTKAQQSGTQFEERFRTSITEAQAAATPDAHHPLLEVSLHDQEILTKIAELSGELEHELSVAELLQVRAAIVQDLSREG